jgi:hypothetical protein
MPGYSGALQDKIRNSLIVLTGWLGNLDSTETNALLPPSGQKHLLFGRFLYFRLDFTPLSRIASRAADAAGEGSLPGPDDQGWQMPGSPCILRGFGQCER